MLLTEAVRKSLSKTGDLERCITRINMRRSTPKDLLSIKYTIEIAEKIMADFVNLKGFAKYKGSELSISSGEMSLDKKIVYQEKISKMALKLKSHEN